MNWGVQVRSLPGRPLVAERVVAKRPAGKQRLDWDRRALAEANGQRQRLRDAYPQSPTPLASRFGYRV